MEDIRVLHREEAEDRDRPEDDPVHGGDPVGPGPEHVGAPFGQSAHTAGEAGTVAVDQYRRQRERRHGDDCGDGELGGAGIEQPVGRGEADAAVPGLPIDGVALRVASARPQRDCVAPLVLLRHRECIGAVRLHRPGRLQLKALIGVVRELVGGHGPGGDFGVILIQPDPDHAVVGAAVGAKADVEGGEKRLRGTDDLLPVHIAPSQNEGRAARGIRGVLLAGAQHDRRTDEEHEQYDGSRDDQDAYLPIPSRVFHRGMRALAHWRILL